MSFPALREHSKLKSFFEVVPPPTKYKIAPYVKPEFKIRQFDHNHLVVPTTLKVHKFDRKTIANKEPHEVNKFENANIKNEFDRIDGIPEPKIEEFKDGLAQYGLKNLSLGELVTSRLQDQAGTDNPLSNALKGNGYEEFLKMLDEKRKMKTVTLPIEPIVMGDDESEFKDAEEGKYETLTASQLHQLHKDVMGEGDEEFEGITNIETPLTLTKEDERLFNIRGNETIGEFSSVINSTSETTLLVAINDAPEFFVDQYNKFSIDAMKKIIPLINKVYGGDLKYDAKSAVHINREAIKKVFVDRMNIRSKTSGQSASESESFRDV